MLPLAAPQAQAPPAKAAPGPIQFAPTVLPFHLESDETTIRHVPATMIGGVAVLDYNRDGKPDLFFTNGANIATLKKDDPKFRNRLLRNDGNGRFADVTAAAGLEGTGYDNGVAVADYDNDGFPDIFVSGVHRNTLYHNNGDGTFTDVTAKLGLDKLATTPSGRAPWSVAAVWLDANNDGRLDLFVVNYLDWDYATEAVCSYKGISDYCAPSYYKGEPNQLFLQKPDGTFEDASAAWGIHGHIGKGMGAAMADYDGDGRPDLFVTNDSEPNFLFHNTGRGFDEVAFQTGSALTEDGAFISGMGVDFRDLNNDGRPDISFTALNNQTFPIFQNMGGGQFTETTGNSGMRAASLAHSGFGLGICDLDNDGWKDIFVSGGHVLSRMTLGAEVDQDNIVFRNPGAAGGKAARWLGYDKAAGLDGVPPARSRGLAFGDFDGDGRVDVVTTAIGRDAVLWTNGSAPRHWLDVDLEGTRSNRDGIGAVVKVVSATLTQYNHRTTSTGYASSSDSPVHFGLGPDPLATTIEIRWPSGTLQTLQNVAVDRVLHVKEAVAPAKP